MYIGTLTKIESDHERFRGDLVEGTFFELPTPGKPFFITGEPLDENADTREVFTSVVQSVTSHSSRKGIYIFSTKNSTFVIYVLLLSEHKLNSLLRRYKFLFY
jgi:hypothetical protein